MLEFWEVVEPSEPFKDNWSVDCFTDHLQNIDQIKRLLVNCPPGTTKSIIYDIMFPVWQWVNNPSKRFLFASHSLDVAIRDSRACRDLIESDKFRAYYPNLIQLSEDQNEKRNFSNDKRGFRQCTSVNGSTTGLKANYLILDDPHNASDAQSPTNRNKCIDWFADVFSNRLNNAVTDSIIVVGQRIHKRDLSNYIIENCDGYTHLNLPYEYKPTTYISPIGWTDPRTTAGEPLWEARFPKAYIKEKKARPAAFAAQWNQNPTDAETQIFKQEDFRYFQTTEQGYKLADRTITKDQTFRVSCVDPAMSETASSDYTAIVTADISADGQVIVVDLVRERIAGTKLIPRLKHVYDTLNPNYILVESYGFGKLIYDQARLDGLPVRAVQTIRTANDIEDIKFIRSLDLQDLIQQGRLWFPLGASWLTVVEQELIDFPSAKHDDITDSLSYVCKEARLRTRGTRIENTVQLTPEQQLKEDNRKWFELVWSD